MIAPQNLLGLKFSKALSKAYVTLMMSSSRPEVNAADSAAAAAASCTVLAALSKFASCTSCVEEVFLSSYLSYREVSIFRMFHMI